MLLCDRLRVKDAPRHQDSPKAICLGPVLLAAPPRDMVREGSTFSVGLILLCFPSEGMSYSLAPVTTLGCVTPHG